MVCCSMEREMHTTTATITGPLIVEHENSIVSIKLIQFHLIAINNNCLLLQQLQSQHLDVNISSASMKTALNVQPAISSANMEFQTNCHAPRDWFTTTRSTDATGPICCWRNATPKQSLASSAQLRSIQTHQLPASGLSHASPSPVTLTVFSFAMKVILVWLLAEKTSFSTKALWRAKMLNKPSKLSFSLLSKFSPSFICKLFSKSISNFRWIKRNFWWWKFPKISQISVKIVSFLFP